MTLPTLNILHLSRRVDREQQLIRQLEWNKVPYVFWEGIDDPTNVKGSICIGHQRIVAYAKDNKLPFVNIAEDDLMFTHKQSYQYFNEMVPDDYDLFFGLVYAGDVNEERRVENGMSGVMTMYRVHERFYDVFLNQPASEHIDRGLGNYCFQYKFYVVPEYCCYQSGGYSDNLRQVMYYSEYLRGKKLFGVAEIT